ncbi:MAG: N-acetyl-gamma-glutamyl-phosphate reductase [Phycisphaerales bacterium]
MRSVGLIGARGFVGVELIDLIGRHAALNLEYASSRQAEGDPISAHAKSGSGSMKFEHLDAEHAAARNADIVVLALPDGAGVDYAQALEQTDSPPELIIDLSADHRFNDDWTYGLPEHNRHKLQGAKRISNPGCYATIAQILIRPLLGKLAAKPNCFGISGYSGAGKKRSDRNDHKSLAHGVWPYKLVGHTHEREIAYQLDTPIRFSPHVAPYFRGITMTIQAELSAPIDQDSLIELFHAAYRNEPLIAVSTDVPRVQDAVGADGASIGGFMLNPDRPTEIAIVGVLDNLRKGAATQAIQNLNLALGFEEMIGLNAQQPISNGDQQ